MNRLAAMQLWPLLIRRASAATCAAFTRSASSSTMNGSLPPSSSTVFFKCRPACCATWLPARSLPVSVTARTRASAMTLPTASFSRNTARNNPSGKPASRKTPSISSAQRDTLGACFKSPAFPATSAGAAKRNTCQNGKFHGMIASTGPMASNRT